VRQHVDARERGELFPASELRARQMADDGFVRETVRSVRAIDQEIGEPASGPVAKLAVPGSVGGDHDLVHDFGKLIAGDIDDDALGLNPGMALAVEPADTVDVLGAGESIFAQVVAQQKAHGAANASRKGGDNEANLGVHLGRVSGADGAAEARGENAQGGDVLKLVHKTRHSIVTGGLRKGQVVR